MNRTTLIRLITLSALIVAFLSGVLQASRVAAGPAGASLTAINVLFKLDQRLTRGQYMGDLWVSPPTYIRLGEGKECTVEARVQGLDNNSRPVDISPEWIPADPEMVSVSPSRGNEVKITVKRAGQSSLIVASPGLSRDLFIKATEESHNLRVEITPGQTLVGELQKTGNDVKNQKEKVSYSLGYETGRSMKNKSVDLDPDIFIKAFREGFAGDKAAMTDQEMRDVILSLRKKMEAKRAEEMKESPEKNKPVGEKNKKEGENFLAENAKKENVVILPSGLQYKVIKGGTGKQPAKTDKVKVHYRGTLINGAEFDNSYSKGGPAVVIVSRAIKGLTEALQLMKEGAKWMLYVPPHLAYGERGTRPTKGKGAARQTIGPNQTLVFEMELISIHNSKEGDKPESGE